MVTIHKYQLEKRRIPMPEGAIIRHVGLDPKGDVCLWAEVDTDNPIVDRFFDYYGTGNPIGRRQRRYVGTITMSRYVWHVYEEEL